MSTLLKFVGAGALLPLIAFLGIAPAQNNPADDDVPDGVEIELRGPVHEAFAQPLDIKPEPGQPVPKQPPEPIPEEPPEERPEGDNVQWIGGYWAWDPERNDFMWVSGTYRNAPVGRQWVPGHWVHTAEGWRWVPGMWAPESQEELRYSPEPPAPLEVEPSLPAPSEDATWVPGTWVYRDPRFVWRPGYWSPYREGRVWVTSRYSWTPNGYLFCDGYWDYPLDDRGLLFAPAYFHRPYWHDRSWFWRPRHVIGLGLLFDSCFTRHGSFHFHFGHFFGSRCWDYGYRPWYYGHGRYHSAFNHHRWRHHRGDRDWFDRHRESFRDRHDGRRSGPPRTLAEQDRLVRNQGGKGGANVRVAAPLSQVKLVNKNVNLVKLTPAQINTQKALAKRTKDIAQIRTQSAKVGGASGVAPRTKQDAPAIKLPPLVRGTETVRPKDGPLSKANIRGKDTDAGAESSRKNLGSDGQKDRTTSKESGQKTFNRPSNVPSVNNLPKNFATPKGNNKGSGPRIIDGSPGPRLAPEVKKGTDVGKPRVVDTPSAPRKANVQPQQPNANKSSASRSSNNNAPAPRVIEGPKAPRTSNSGPRIIEGASAPRNVDRGPKSIDVPKAPRSSNFNVQTPRNFDVPRSNPAPRIASPAPRYNPPAPRAAPAPRMAAPRSSPAPRMSAPRSSPAPRSAPAPRGGGGGGKNRR
jgi:hypothetical protein